MCTDSMAHTGASVGADLIGVSAFGASKQIGNQPQKAIAVSRKGVLGILDDFQKSDDEQIRSVNISKGLLNTDTVFGEQILDELDSNIGDDLKKALELYSRLSSYEKDHNFSVNTDIGDINSSDEDAFDTLLFGDDMTKSISNIKDTIQGIELSSHASRGQGIPLANLTSFIGISGPKNTARIRIFEANIGADIEKIELLNSLETEIAGINSSAKQISNQRKAGYHELEKHYIGYIYIIEVVNYHLTNLRRDSEKNISQIRDLEKIIGELIKKTSYMQSRILIEKNYSQQVLLRSDIVELEDMLKKYDIIKLIDEAITQEKLSRQTDEKDTSQGSIIDKIRELFLGKVSCEKYVTVLLKSGMSFVSDFDSQRKYIQGRLSETRSKILRMHEESIEAGRKLQGIDDTSVPMFVDDSAVQ